MNDKHFVPRPCKVPTQALAGSKEKIEILKARLEAGEELFHPNDNPRIAERSLLATATN